MHEHILDAVLQRDSARVTGSACSSELEHHHPIFKAAVFNISAILLDGWSDSGFE